MDDERRVLEPGAVAIAGDRIAAVGASEQFAHLPARRTIDCTRCAVIPGLIDAHTHLFETLARGLGDGIPEARWLREFVWGYASTINAVEAAVSARLGSVEALRSGTTCLLDSHYAPPDFEATVAVAQAVEDVGARGVITRGIIGPPTEIALECGFPDWLFGHPAEELRVMRACMEAKPAGGRVVIWPSPYMISYVDHDLTHGIVALAHELDTGWHTHCNEIEPEPGLFESKYGLRPITWLSEHGLLDDRATFAHLVWCDDDEVAHAGKAGAGAVNCPVSSSFLGSGVIRMADLREAGAVIALGTDGPICSHRQDMFEAMKQSVLMQRLYHASPQVMNAERALELATREAARLCRVDAGSLEPGKLADIAVVGLRDAHVRPANRTLGTLIYAARGGDVQSTIVGGEVVYENGRCTRIDEEQLDAQAQAAADGLIERAGLRWMRAGWSR